ncbi:MAG: hypothetical protein ACT4PV_05705 [Planctomycetaceae bacterium]
MKKGVAAVVGLAIVGMAAIVIGRHMLKPAAEKQERSRTVLTGLTEPRLARCRILEDSEVPEGVEAPRVGEAVVYLAVEILYPAAARVPEHAGMFLSRVNGASGRDLEPVHTETDSDEDGAYLYLVFKVEEEFQYAQIRREDKVVLARVSPE